MSIIKHPFDYLTDADHVRINRWLSHPNPDIKSAVEILGVDKNALLENRVTTHIGSSSAHSKTNFFSKVFGYLDSKVRRKRPMGSLAELAQPSLPRAKFSLTGTKSAPLNPFVEQLNKLFSTQIEAGAIELTLTRGRPSIFGSGTSAFLRATVILNHDQLADETIREIEALIDSAKASNAEVSVQKNREE